MEKGGSAKGGRARRLLKLPVKFLAKARDFYVLGMSQLSDQMRYDAVSSMGCPAHINATVPRSFSVGSTKSGGSDYSELVRAASSSARGNIGNRAIVNQEGKQGEVGIKKVPRSQSVGLGRIEEEKSDCFSGEDSFCNTTDTTSARSVVVPRSRSCSVFSRTSGKFMKPAAVL